MTSALPEVLEKLEPCPFCGGEASATGVVRYHESHEAWFADGTRVTTAYFCNCTKCGINNMGLIGHQTREAAITAWNTRHELLRDAGDAQEWRPQVEAEPNRPYLIYVPAWTDNSGHMYPELVTVATCEHPNEYGWDWQLVEAGYRAEERDVYPYPTHIRPLPQPPAMHAPGGAGGGS